jgi:hypothetical protein
MEMIIIYIGSPLSQHMIAFLKTTNFIEQFFRTIQTLVLRKNKGLYIIGGHFGIWGRALANIKNNKTFGADFLVLWPIITAARR